MPHFNSCLQKYQGQHWNLVLSLIPLISKELPPMASDLRITRLTVTAMRPKLRHAQGNRESAVVLIHLRGYTSGSTLRFSSRRAMKGYGTWLTTSLWAQGRQA